MATTAPAPTDLAAEIAELESELDQAIRAAARAKLNSADHEAAFLSERLEAKKAELKAAEEAETQAEQDRQHAMRLTLLQELGAKESAAKADVLQLQRELATLPGRLQMAQAQHSELCRMRARLKQELGL